MERCLFNRSNHQDCENLILVNNELPLIFIDQENTKHSCGVTYEETVQTSGIDCIHPKDKKTVGIRLALIALNRIYSKSDVRYSDPVLDTYKIEGSTIKLFFNNSTAKPVIRDGGTSVLGFEIAGADGIFRAANASIQDNIVIVSSESIQQPLAVRYAWTDNPEKANLIGDNGLPAGPFRLTVRK
jgi:sialate O-acetylesterase